MAEFSWVGFGSLVLVDFLVYKPAFSSRNLLVFLRVQFKENITWQYKPKNNMTLVY